MLVLQRNVNERIVIDGPCVITLVDARAGRAWLGIDADLEVNIVREELTQRESDGSPVRAWMPDSLNQPERTDS